MSSRRPLALAVAAALIVAGGAFVLGRISVGEGERLRVNGGDLERMMAESVPEFESLDCFPQATDGLGRWWCEVVFFLPKPIAEGGKKFQPTPGGGPPAKTYVVSVEEDGSVVQESPPRPPEPVVGCCLEVRD